VFFVVVKAELKYKAPAKYDDEVTLTTKLVKVTHVRYDHEYVLKRGNAVLCEGSTVIACVDRNGELPALGLHHGTIARARADLEPALDEPKADHRRAGKHCGGNLEPVCV